MTDYSLITDHAQDVTSRTVHVLGSVSLPEYSQHLTALEEARDALTSARNDLKRRIDVLKNEERELKRLQDKILDHWARTKTAANDRRFNRDVVSGPPPPSA